MTVVAIVPAKDCASTVGPTVRALLTVEPVDRVLVVDDGSTDGTTAAARAAGAQVLRLGSNRGKGDAVLAGANAAADAEVLLLVDADVGSDAARAGELLAPVLDGRADLAIGVLPPAGRRGGFGTIRRLARWGVRRASGLDASAPLSGQRAVRAELVRSLERAGRFGLEVAMTIDAVRAGARVTEVPVAMEHRHRGRSLGGFRHRAGQGFDVAAALWTRLLPQRLRRGLLAVVVAAGVAGSYLASALWTPATAAAKAHARKVVVFGIPHLGLADVTRSEMPNLYRLSQRGAYGMVTTRTGGDTSSSAEYATLGAGDRVSADSSSGMAFGRSETVEGDPAADVVARRTGVAPKGAVVLPEIAPILRSAGSHIDSRPGALGDALRRQGLRTAVVANSDALGPDGSVERSAPAALAVTTSGGDVDAGDVSHSLVSVAPAQPFGLGINEQRFVAAAEEALRRADVVALDPGETDRAAAYAPLLSPAEVETVRRAALARTDRILGAVASRLPAGAQLFIVGLSPPGRAAELSPIVVYGTGVPSGRLQSPSTRRADLVTLTDVAPSVLQALGGRVPAAMIGEPIRYMSGRPDRGSMLAQNKLVKARDATYGNVLNTFVWSQAVLYVIAALFLVTGRTRNDVLQVLRIAVLTMAAWPLATFLLRAAAPLYELGAGTHALLWAVALALGLIASTRRRHPLDPLLALAAGAVLLLCVDSVAGGPLQVSSFLGYTPTAAARFVGLGNAAFAVLAAGAVITCVAVTARSPRSKDAWWLAAGVALAAVVADGAPWLGSDVGGILALVPVLGLVLYLLRGHRLNWRIIGIAAAAALAVLAMTIGFEALRAPDQRTHIGHFFLGGAGQPSFWTTIDRKWATNVRVLSSSTWSWLIPITIAFTVAIVATSARWRRLIACRSAEAVGLMGLLLVAVAGWALNDSGPVVAALVLVYAPPYAALVHMQREAPPDELLEAGAAAALERVP